MTTTHPNLAGLARFTARAKAEAAAMRPDAGRKHLMTAATKLNDWLAKLGCPDCPAHLEGVSAFDLSNARDELVAASMQERVG
jgi:hypothetical protein